MGHVFLIDGVQSVAGKVFLMTSIETAVLVKPCSFSTNCA